MNRERRALTDQDSDDESLQPECVNLQNQISFLQWRNNLHDRIEMEIDH